MTDNEEQQQKLSIQRLELMLDQKILPELKELKDNMRGMEKKFEEGFNHLAGQITATYSEYNKKFVRQDNYDLITKEILAKLSELDKSKAGILVERLMFGLVGVMLLALIAAILSKVIS